MLDRQRVSKREHAYLPFRLLLSPGQGSGYFLLAFTDKAKGILGVCTLRRTSNWTHAPTVCALKVWESLKGKLKMPLLLRWGKWLGAFR